MVIWSGFGILTVVFAALGVLGGSALVSGASRLGINLSQPAGIAISLVIAAVVNWFVGRQLNVRAGRAMIDAETGERVILRKRHRLLWVPMQYWSIAMVVFAVLAVVSNHVPRDPSPTHQPS